MGIKGLIGDADAIRKCSGRLRSYDWWMDDRYNDCEETIRKELTCGRMLYDLMPWNKMNNPEHRPWTQILDSKEIPTLPF